MKTYKISFAIFRRVLDFGIVVYLLIIPIILITAGLELHILGISIRATNLYTPMKILIPLILTRLLITFRVKDFLLLLSSMILSLFVVEIVIRIWNLALPRPEMGQIHRAPRIFGWELVPASFGIKGAGESYKIISAGFQDTEHEL
jgi:hypothetical protein